MKKVLGISLLLAGLFSLSPKTTATVCYTNGSGGDKVINGVTYFQCPKTGGATACLYPTTCPEL